MSHFLPVTPHGHLTEYGQVQTDPPGLGGAGPVKAPSIACCSDSSAVHCGGLGIQMLLEVS